MSKRSVTVGVRVTPELYERLVLMARRDGRTLSNLLFHVLSKVSRQDLPPKLRAEP